MLIDIVEVKPLSEYKLFLRFEDGTSGEIDIAAIVVFKGIFKKLADKEYFSKVKLNPDFGTICWDNAADLSPCALYKNLKH